MSLPSDRVSLLLHELRCQLALAGFNPLAIDWGPWFEESYYAA